MIFKLFWTIWGRLRCPGPGTPAEEEGTGGPAICLPVIHSMIHMPLLRQPISKPAQDATPIDLEVLQ